jgi:anaerobic magnesium-protoporphyrin IX monomethyl ester cyclase
MKFLLASKYSVIEPLGLMFLESTLRRLGWDVRLVLFGGDPEKQKISKEFDFIGFSVFTGYHNTIFRICENIRRDWGTKVIIGGPHATFFSDSCLKYADYVVVGEGVKSIERICKGEAKDGKVFEPELVSEIEILSPYRKTLYQTYPSFLKNPIKNVMASFGCPYCCSYCFNDSYGRLYGKKIVRYRSVESVIEECAELKDYPLDLIFFQDDCFGFNLEWLKEFSRRYKGDVGKPFHCQMRPETATMERLRLLAEAGCHGITLAIESYNEKTREELLNRKMKNTDILRACYLIKGLGMKLRTEQMLGLPNTTLEDELELLKLNARIQPNIAWTSVFSPYLGTELGDYCKEMGLYDGNNDDLEDNFFSNSKLKLGEERIRKTNQLQRIFSTCAKMRDGDVLARLFLDGEKYDFDAWFSAMRKHLYDSDLYRVGRSMNESLVS